MANAAVPSVTMLLSKEDENSATCTQMKVVMNELKANYKGKLTISNIYLDDNPEIAKKYNVRYVPTLIFRKASGEVITQEIGVKSASEIIRIFANAKVKI